MFSRSAPKTIGTRQLRSRVIALTGSVVLAAGLAVAAAAAPSAQAQSSAPLSASQGRPHTITWDNYSLMIDGQRTFIWSGEFHYYRLPSPSLWTDVLEKMKAAGFNAVSLYFDWAYHSSTQGLYDFTGVRDVGKLLDIADQLGIYVLARPGPYINAELDAGGMAGWVLTDAPLRTSTACTKNCPPYGSYQAQANDWLHNLDSIIADHQLTNGTGSVIGYQIENETSCTAGAQATYMSNLANQVRDDGVTVPLFVNNVNLGGQCVPSSAGGSGGTRVDWNDLYGYDNYPQGFNCSAPYSWSSAADNEANFRRFDTSTPIFIPEFQGGSFDNWGGPTYDACATRTNGQFEQIFYQTNIANGTTMESNYMTFGGTSWGWEPVNNTVYSSYDYGSSITEGRGLRPKYYTEKELGLMFQSVAPLTRTDAASTVTAANISPDPATTCTNGPGGATLNNCGAIKVYHRVDSTTGTNFYWPRHNDSRATLDSTFSLPITTGDGTFSIPQSGRIELNGRQMNVITADYNMDSQHLVYSTSNLMTHATINGQDTALLWLPTGQSGETVLRYSQQPAVTTLSGPAPTVTWDASTGDLRLDYTHDGLTKVRISGGGTNPSTGQPTNPLLLLLADDPTAQQFWTQTTPAGQVLEQGPELVRSASVTGSRLDLTGDTTAPTDLTVWAPAGVTAVTWNGAPVATSVNADGSLSTTSRLAGPPQLSLPPLTGWQYAAEAPEAQPGFNDASWTSADHTATNNPTDPPAGQPVLYADDYGYHYGDVWYRGHLTPSSDLTSITVASEPGARGISEVWLNGTFLGSHDNGSSETNTTTYTVPAGTTKIGADNVLSILVRDMSHNEGGTANHPRGLTSVTVAGASAPISWKIQGDQGGERPVDTVRGPQNNGGLYGERAGWYLPNYPDSNWTPVTLPNSDPNPGVAWYRTTFTLHEPAGVDASLGLNISDITSKAYRATIFLNGWNLGQYINNTGPQHTFALPNGILHTGIGDDGKNTLAIAVITNNAGGGTTAGGLGAVTLTGMPSVYTYDDRDPAITYTGTGWSHVGTEQTYTGPDYQNTESFSATTGDSFSTTFTGTAVRWIASKAANHGIGAVFLDGTQVATVDGYGANTLPQQVLWSAFGLTPGQHTLQIVNTGQSNPSSSGTFLDVDAIDVPPAGVVNGGLPVTDVNSPRYVVPVASARTIHPTVGTQFNGSVGQLAVPADARGTAFAATIDWGDGTSSPATLVPAGNSYDIQGSHTYTAPGSYNLTVTVTDSVDQATLATASGKAIT